jgi:SAM-dependent methyltransferase
MDLYVRADPQTVNSAPAEALKNFVSVTEIPGDLASREQIARAYHRYSWAALQAAQKDVLEVACGAGPGLGLLARVAKSVMAVDISDDLLGIAMAHYGTRVRFQKADASAIRSMPRAFDLILLFEAIYYLKDPDNFVASCRCALRPGGKILVVTANKDLYDFNPSPFSNDYLGVVELAGLFGRHDFAVRFYGHDAVSEISWRQKILRPAKRWAAGLGLIPKTMKGKQLLKRIVFGRLRPMPAEFLPDESRFVPPDPIAGNAPNREYKVIYCVASNEDQGGRP